MKIQHLEYVLAIAQEGSITKAAKKLYQAQPNISIALKELEESLGIQIFQRTQSGMITTPEGEEFIDRAKNIVEEFHSLEAMYTRKENDVSQLSISATKSPYVADAIGRMINDLENTEQDFNVSIMESSTNRVIEDICNGVADVGVLRIPTLQLDILQERLESKKLCSKTILEYRMYIMFAKEHPLAKYKSVPYELLKNYPEIINKDLEDDIIRKATINPDYDTTSDGKKIYVCDRGTQISMLNSVKDAFVWIGPIHPAAIGIGKITVRPCSFATCYNRDIIIYRKKSENNPLIRRSIEYITKSAEMLLVDPVFDI